MKVKEVNETANVAWSPAAIHPMYLACGTTAKQLDASFNTSSTLNIYNLNAGQSNLDMVLAASVESPARFHALQWSGLGGSQFGLIYGGCENGSIYIYDAAKLLIKAPDSLVGKTEGLHPGPVFTLSCNYLKANFVACGSSDSEVTVWDITNLSAPIIPGKKLSLGAEVSSVDFNRQVEHIFASTCAGHCVVWDLRKHSSIMTISDSVSRMKASSIVWNPNVATQLLLASDSDVTPWAQVWDLRYASSPIKTLEGHQQGVLKTLWCAHDGNLLITTAKDNKIYLWNPNEAQRGSEIVGEFPSYNQWSFDIDWGKRDPSLVATASVDGCVSVYSLLGGGLPPTQSDKFSQIADSFPGMEMPTVAPQGVTPQPIRLKNPPKWFPQTAGASFAFGGQLVSWNNQSRSVEIARVVTEQALVERSSQLEEALSQPHFAPFCQAKAEAATQPSDQILWQYIGANFESSPRSRYMELLGYSSGQVASKIHPVVPENGVSAEVLADKMENLGTNEITNEQEEVDSVPSKEMQTENEETEAEEPFDPFVADDVKKQLLNSPMENSEKECPAIPETPTEAEDREQGEREITKDEEEVDSLPSKGMQSENEETVVEGELVTFVPDDVREQLADSPFEDSERDLPTVPEPTTEAADKKPGEREITEDEEEVDSLPSKGMQSENEETAVEGELDTFVADDVREQLADSPFEDSERNLPAVPELPTEAEDKKPGEREGSTSSLDPSEQFEMIASGHSFDKTPETEVVEPEPEAEASMPVVSLEVEEKEENSHGMITQALLVGDLESAVDLCIKDRLFPHALTLAAHAGPELFSKTRDAVLEHVDGSLSSLVGAIVHGDLTSISAACNLSRWKEALVAALTYSSDEQFPSLAESLGERLEAKGDAEALLSALICYVCAGSLEKFVSCWIKTRPETNKPSELQDLVEIIMGLQHSLAATGRSANISEGSTVSSLLCQYASLLAAQGALNTAVSYLNSATQGDMVELRDRLYRALGYTTGSTIQPSPQIPSSTTPQTSNLRRTSTPHSINQSQFVKVQQPSALLRLMPSQFTPSVQDQQRSLYGDPISGQSAIPPPSPGFYSPAPPVPSVPPVSEVPPMMIPQYGVQTPMVSMQPTPPPTTGPPPSGPAMSGGFRRGGPSRYVPDIARPAPPAHMLNPAQPPQPSSYLPPLPGANPVPLNPSQPTIPAQTPPQFFSPAAPPSGNPVYGDQQQQQQQPSAPQPPPKTPAAFDLSVPRGWNDPPPLSSSRKAKQQQQQQQQQNEASKAPEPIMCPVPGSVVPEPPQQFMGFQHPQYGSEAQGPGAGSAAPVAPTSAPEPASKGPLPPEHQVVQDVMTEVQNRCLQVVQNQQMKQRLEDIGVKMEALYDKLRAGQLGPIAVSGVHRIVSAVQSGDYRGALSVHAETIGKGSFSELSSFMPSVKLLLQYCMQLQVFL